jgi:hypothetical protein
MAPAKPCLEAVLTENLFDESGVMPCDSPELQLAPQGGAAPVRFSSLPAPLRPERPHSISVRWLSWPEDRGDVNEHPCSRSSRGSRLRAS